MDNASFESSNDKKYRETNPISKKLVHISSTKSEDLHLHSQRNEKYDFLWERKIYINF